MGENKDILHTKWVEGTLSEKERLAYESSKDGKVISDIINEVDSWLLPPISIDYHRVKEKLVNKSIVKPIVMYRKLVVAAGLILVGILSFVFYSLAGESMKVIFPDGTTALMNGNSYISFNENNWKENRSLTIKGQAIFDVDIKGPFRVNFNGGVVNVLGTKFEVLAVDNYSKIKCYEGVVNVIFDTTSKILNANQSIDTYYHTNMVEFKEHTWNEEHTQFTNASLMEVLASLSLNYDYQFDYSHINVSKLFTGQFINSNGPMALKMVFEALNIKYTQKGKLITLQ